MRDGRRFIKFLDFDYHQKQPGFELFRKEWESSKGTIHIGQAGWLDASTYHRVCIYTAFPNQILIKPGCMLYTWKDLREILSCFEDTENITDDEWKMFCVVMPDQVKKIGKSTESFGRINLFLQGKGKFRVSE